MDHLLTFWRELVLNPREVGALLPSSRGLGVAMADEVRKQTPGYVIELGAGTGSITRALLGIRDCMAGYSILEKSPQLARALLNRFPQLQIKEGCASTLATLTFPEDEPLTVVSSLPFRSMRKEQAELIMDAIEQLSRRKAGFRMIQYSYFPVAPFACGNNSYQWHWKKTVLFNVSPAIIWELKKFS